MIARAFENCFALASVCSVAEYILFEIVHGCIMFCLLVLIADVLFIRPNSSERHVVYWGLCGSERRRVVVRRVCRLSFGRWSVAMTTNVNNTGRLQQHCSISHSFYTGCLLSIDFLLIYCTAVLIGRILGFAHPSVCLFLSVRPSVSYVVLTQKNTKKHITLYGRRVYQHSANIYFLLNRPIYSVQLIDFSHICNLFMEIFVELLSDLFFNLFFILMICPSCCHKKPTKQITGDISWLD